MGFFESLGRGMADLNPFAGHGIDTSKQDADAAAAQARATQSYGDQQMARLQEQRHLGQLADYASGKDASAAQLMLGAAQEGNQAAAMSRGASARGGNVGLAQYQAANQAADANQQAAYQGSLLRSNEQMGWNQLYGQSLAGMRGADINAMGANLGANAQLGLGAMQASAAEAQADAQRKAGFFGMAGTGLAALAK